MLFFGPGRILCRVSMMMLWKTVVKTWKGKVLSFAVDRDYQRKTHLTKTWQIRQWLLWLIWNWPHEVSTVWLRHKTGHKNYNISLHAEVGKQNLNKIPTLNEEMEAVSVCWSWENSSAPRMNSHKSSNPKWAVLNTYVCGCVCVVWGGVGTHMCKMLKSRGQWIW